MLQAQLCPRGGAFMDGGESPCSCGLSHCSLSHCLLLFEFKQFKTFSFLLDRSYDFSDEVDVSTFCVHIWKVSAAPRGWLFGFHCHKLQVPVSHLLLICLSSDISSTLALFCATVSNGVAVLASSLPFSSFWSCSAFVFAPFLHLVPARPKPWLLLAHVHRSITKGCAGRAVGSSDYSQLI